MKERTLNAWCQRTLAVILAISMVLIPVHIPGHVHAENAEAVEHPVLFEDDFADSAYAEGTSYKWVKSGTTSITDGTLVMNKSSEVRLAVYAPDASSSARANLGDHAVEVKFTKNVAGTKPYAILRTRAQTVNGVWEYYQLEVTGNADSTSGALAFRRYYSYYDETAQKYKQGNTLFSSASLDTVNFANGMHTMKIVVSGEDLYVYYDGVCKNKVNAETGEYIPFNDPEGVTPLTGGEVALATGSAAGTVTYDDLVVTDLSGKTLFKEDFSNADRFASGHTFEWTEKSTAEPQDVTYTWTNNEWGTQHGAHVHTITDGVYKIYTPNDRVNGHSYLNGTVNGQDISDLWTDYTVSVDIKKTTDSNYGAGVVGRVRPVYDGETIKGYIYYQVLVHKSNVRINKSYIDANGTVQRAAPVQGRIYDLPVGGASNGVQVTLEVKFSGNRITVYLYDAEGKLLESQLTEKQRTFVDDKESYTIGGETTATGAALPVGGNVGIAFIGGTSNAAWSAEYDNFKVTLPDGTVAFEEDFDMSGSKAAANAYLNAGKTVTVGESNYTYKWSHSSTSGKLWIDDGRLVSNSVSKSALMLSASATDPENSESTVDPMMNWTNYSVEVDIARLFRNNPTEEGGLPVTANGDCYLAFNLKSEDGVNYTGNAFKFHPSHIYYGTITINKNGSFNREMSFTSSGTAISSHGAVAGDIMKFKVDIANKDLKITAFNSSGTQIGSTFVKNDYLTNIGGNIALMTDTPSDASVATYFRGASYDNLKITLNDGSENGVVVFNEEFNMDGNAAATAAYMAESKVLKNAFRPNVSEEWTITDGAYGSDGTNSSVSYVTMKSGNTDLAQAWTDYMVNAKMTLDATSGVGSLLARYSDQGYYEMRVAADGTVGLYRSGVENALATYTPETAAAVLAPVEVDAQLEVYGTKLIGSINGTKVVEYDTAEDDVKLTAGTAGVTSGTNVTYDDFSVTTHEFSEEWSQDQAGTYHYHACTATGCTVISGKEDHTVGTAATCKVGNICAVCELTYGDVNPDNHVAGAEKVWTKTGTQHQQKWNCCDAVVVALEDHEWDKGTCTECEYVCVDHTGGEAHCQTGKICETCGKEYTDKDPNNHPISSAWVKTETTHKKVFNGCCQAEDTEYPEDEHTFVDSKCTVCEYECPGHTGGTATCTAKAKCSICGVEYGELNANNHAAEAEWVKTQTTHKKWYDDCCDAIVTAEDEHNFVDGKCSICEYECTSHTGGTATCIAKAVCTNCGESYGELNANNHAYGPKWVRTAENHKLWYEDCCQVVEVAEEPHEWENGMCVECTAICEHTGGIANCQSGKICEICEKEYTAKDATVHTKEAKWTRTETKHTKIYECCSAIAVAEDEHTLVNGVCSVCNYGCTHSGGEATCTAKAKCEVCGEEYGEKNSDKHTGEAKWENTADKHKKVYDCCDKVAVEEAAHTGGTATCKAQAVCSVCGEKYGELAAGHTGGEATCTAKAKCSVCGEEYGEKNPDKHTGEAKWSYTDEKHTKKYDCCGAAAVAEEAHKLTDGKCECGYAAPKPAEPGEIENTTDPDKNACGGSLDVKDEHLDDKLLTEEEKEAVKGGADIEISLKIEDISDKVPAADKTAVENKLGNMKVGMYLNIDLEKKIGDNDPVKITKTNGGVTITITVPEALINTDAKIVRTYKVIRVHEGVADILDAIFDAKTGKLSFETDKFSTYTLVYSDAPSSDNSNTGDNTMFVLFGGLLALSALAATVILVPDIRKKLMGK